MLSRYLHREAFSVCLYEEEEYFKLTNIERGREVCKCAEKKKEKLCEEFVAQDFVFWNVLRVDAL